MDSFKGKDDRVADITFTVWVQHGTVALNVTTDDKPNDEELKYAIFLDPVAAIGLADKIYKTALLASEWND
jgi:hypothetical protein